MTEDQIRPSDPPTYLSPEARAVRAMADGRVDEDALRAAIAREIRQAISAGVKDAEEIEKLRQSEKHYRVFAEQSSDVFWIMGLDMKFSYVSPSVERMRGFKPEDVLKQQLDEIFTPPSLALIAGSLQQALHAETAGLIEPHLWRVMELEQLCKDGRTLWTEAAATWLKNEQGQVIGVLGVTRNIDARKRAEEVLRRAHEELELRVVERTAELRTALDELRRKNLELEQLSNALRESEKRARTQYKGIPIPTYTWQRKGADFVLLDWNDAAIHATEGGITEWTGQLASHLFRERPDIRDDMAHCFAEKCAHRREMLYRFQSAGKERFVDASYAFIEPDLVLVHVADITERKLSEERERRHQEELRQADKLVALGSLVSGVAHEINNPNHVISLNVSTFQSLVPELLERLDRHASQHGEFQVSRLPWTQVREELPRLLEDVRTASNRIKRIVTDLKEYARPDSVEQPAPFSLNAAVEDAANLMRSVLRKATGQFELHLDAQLPPVVGRKRRIEQVIINLLQNACQALSENHQAIHVRTYRTEKPPRIVVEVRDEGGGIAPEHLSRLTDPFFTTKREKGGTGLGLAVSLGIARDHGGELEFQSVQNQGTTARLILPVTEDSLRESP